VVTDCFTDHRIGVNFLKVLAISQKQLRELDASPPPDIRIANRSAINERAAQGNLSQFNSLDLLLPWFGSRRLKVQILSPRQLLIESLAYDA